MKLDFLKVVNAGALAAYSPKLEQFALDSIRLEPTLADEMKLKIGATKLGGNPDLPVGHSWPLWQKKEKPTFIERFVIPFLKNPKGGGPAPLNFIGQINLFDMQKYNVNRLLPNEGILYFFHSTEANGYSPHDSGSSKVIYYSGKTAWLDHLEPENTEITFPCYGVEFRHERTIPPADYLFAKVPFSEIEKESYKDLEEHNLRPVHRLFGHPEAIQNGYMQVQCELLSRGLGLDYEMHLDREERDQLREQADEWTLLLQVGELKQPEEQHTHSWGDLGVIYFWIRRGDLIKRNFDNIWTIHQYF